MAHIKKLVMHGFKSFPRKTEIPFTEGINVILGPNGSGKSNVSDALCFVLGRLSIKSMRAAKARNLIFLGTKAASPAKEASVEMVFDNSNRTFSIDKNEVSIKRIVRKNGQSIYKINNETKTRQQVLGLLAQAGIDPNGFNIILQGEIQNFVRMYPDDRRKILEEVSGISIYESRKEKSLKELNKTEEKLKEVAAILRERTAYLNNLEKERQQALRFKKLEKDVKILKASVISYDINKNKKEIEKINEEIAKKNKEIDKIKKSIIILRTNIENFESKINYINKTIQESTGLEQEKLNQEIANIRAELAGLSVRSENYGSKHSVLLKQKQEFEETIKETEEYIQDLKKTVSKSSSSKKTLKDKEVELKKQELEKLEEQRKKFYMAKSELKSIKERFQDKTSLLKNYENESEFLLRQMKILYEELFDKNTNKTKVESLRLSLAQRKEILDSINKREIELERISSANENEIDKENKLIENISKMDVCPICKSKITEAHVHEINQDTLPRLNNLNLDIEKSDKELVNIHNKKDLIKQDIDQLTSEISKRESDLMKLLNIGEKKQQLKEIQERVQKTKEEFTELDKIKKRLERNFEDNQNIEQKYETTRVEVQEISLRNEEDVDSEISFKQRELDRSKISLKQLLREQEDLHEEIKAVQNVIDEKEKILEKKNKQEEELSKKFQQLISEKDNFQKKIRENEYELSDKKNIIYNIEQDINNFKIDKARVDAIVENHETELLEFKNIQVIKSKRENLVERLVKTQDMLARIGSINMRSLEVYDSVKREYDSVRDKSEIITKEKEGILKIIHEIDIKKKKVFLKTLDELNEKFSSNFTLLSTKGQVSLDLENRKDPFDGGVNIIVKTGHGKYFDVRSLSGGEQVLVALSLIFAIQELNPYCFYILDEIDAALDKRNSERLANLLQKYMKKGQYIVITHNDEVISNATNLYGVSMHDGISKIISLKI
ncbi:chromosome segregation protein SMC [Candidatus Pacearchaeota archaeon]|nr:chromosome segregation protein SMC [Candidatus Pacearchaeota archaeon]